MAQASPPTNPTATVYYDGACPVCAREIAHYRTRQGADALAWVDVATCPPTALGAGLDRDAALSAMHVRLADGTLVQGAAAFGAIWRGLPGFAWLGRFLALPGVTPLAELGYRAFLRVRKIWR
jgi:predicted DCC family thiol-disulfide oxidoreductase YuxK